MTFVACGVDDIFDPDMNYSLLTDVHTGQQIVEDPLEESKGDHEEEVKEAVNETDIRAA